MKSLGIQEKDILDTGPAVEFIFLTQVRIFLFLNIIPFV